MFGCPEFVVFDQLDAHLHLKCRLRKMTCRLGCGVSLFVRDMEDHEKVHCNLRNIICDVCDEVVVSNKISDHLHNHCPQRVLVVENPFLSVCWKTMNSACALSRVDGIVEATLDQLEHEDVTKFMNVCPDLMFVREGATLSI